MHVRTTLGSISLRGFKTIADLSGEHRFDMRTLNVLIGPNGAGKSNFISFFRLLSWALTPPGKLQEHVARQGGASVILTDGPESTREIAANIQLLAERGANEYAFRLAYAADDTLLFTEEKYRFSRSGLGGEAAWRVLAVAQREPQIVRESEAGEQTARMIHNLLRRVVVYQFNNTSETARIRGKWHKDDCRYLKEDGANLAPILYRLSQNEPAYYGRIVSTIRLVLPFFDDFELDPQYDHLLLRWREKHTDRVFSASQAADGMLRAIALVTLLLLPPHDWPDVMILDEPELGLHPAAVEIVGGLIRAASSEIQVILATQSLAMVDCFEPEDIVVVERDCDQGRHTRFRRLDRDSLQSWLEEYSLSELWEKNVLGGRP